MIRYLFFIFKEKNNQQVSGNIKRTPNQQGEIVIYKKSKICIKSFYELCKNIARSKENFWRGFNLANQNKV